MPADTGKAGRRYVIRGGAVLSMDAAVGDFAQADVLVEGKKIVAVGPKLEAGGAAVVDARGRIVMPGFIDTHHHQFETALRSFLADGLLTNDGTPHGAVNYFDYILGKFARVYRPQDVYINELYGSLSQLDAGVTTVHDISQIHHSPEHSDAAIKGIVDSGRRAAFGYFEGHGDKTKYPGDAVRIKKQYFSSDDQLITMIMGGEIYLPGHEKAWEIGRRLKIPVAAHIVGTLGMGETFDKLAAEGKFGPDLLFIHMTGISDAGWKATKDAGVGVSIAFPIEMTMRHGMPPILKTLEMGIQPSLSVDVECTMTADFFTQMRSAMTLQRALVNQMAIEGKKDAARSADLARCDPLCHGTGRQGPEARSQGRLAHPGQGSGHPPARRHGDQRGPAQSRARRRGHADGPLQRRHGDRRGQGAQVEGAAAECESSQAARRARGVTRLSVQGRGREAGPVP